MAPGLFCVWSHSDPDAVATVNPDDETFTDHVTKLPGVSLGTQISKMKGQIMEYPYNHDIPFLTMYDIPDIKYCDTEAFKQVEEECLKRSEGTCKPRLYEEIYRRDVEGCEDCKNPWSVYDE